MLRGTAPEGAVHPRSPAGAGGCAGQLRGDRGGEGPGAGRVRAPPSRHGIRERPAPPHGSVTRGVRGGSGGTTPAGDAILQKTSSRRAPGTMAVSTRARNGWITCRSAVNRSQGVSARL